MNFKKMLINFRIKFYSGIIPFVYEGKEEIRKQYEVSMTVCMGSIADQ